MDPDRLRLLQAQIQLDLLHAEARLRQTRLHAALAFMVFLVLAALVFAWRPDVPDEAGLAAALPLAAIGWLWHREGAWVASYEERARAILEGLGKERG